MSYQCFDVSVEDRVAHIVLNRPEKRNCMSPVFWDELPAIVRDIDAQAQARVIVISSTGPHFTSGLDLNAFAPNPEAAPADHSIAAAHFMQNVKRMQDTFTSLADCRIPVIAAIQGGCIGGGVDLATACDLRYTTSDAFFTVQEINIAMAADVGTFPRLTYLLPEGIVKELAYTGRRLSADEAKSYGLVNGVYPSQSDMLDAVMSTAKEIAEKAPMAISGSKKMIHYARHHSTQDALDYVAVWNASMLSGHQMMEAAIAPMEKRSPNYPDLPVDPGKIDGTSVLG